jgi:xylulokinase
MGHYALQLASVRNPQESALTGNRVSASTTLAAGLLLLRDIEPEAFRGADVAGLVGTWLGKWLTGELGVDPSEASYTGVFATTVLDGGWLEDLLEDRLHLSPARLPPIRQSLQTLGLLTRSAANELGLPVGVPVVMGAADTPAASYALGASPGSRPYFSMGTTHVVSACLGAPEPEPLALQRADVRPGQWLLNGVTCGGDALAWGATTISAGVPVSVPELVGRAAGVDRHSAVDAPTFIPHVRAERGPLWLDQPCSRLIERAPARDDLAARGVVEGILFGDRLVIEACVADVDSSLLLAGGAYDDDSPLPQLLADACARPIDVVHETHLSAFGAAGMSAESILGFLLPPPTTTRIEPRPEWAEMIETRWSSFRGLWRETAGREPPVRARSNY